MILRFLSAAALCLSFGQAAFAECVGTNTFDQISDENRVALEADVATFPYPHGRHWEVVKDGNRSLLIGTYHLPDPRIAVVNDQMRTEIEAASLLLVEFTATEEARMNQSMASDPSIAFNMEGPRLKDQLNDTEWEELIARGRAIDLPPTALNIMKPWFVGLTLATPACALLQIRGGAKGLDKKIEAAASDAGIPITGLDRFEDVFAVFSQETPEKQLGSGLIKFDPEPDRSQFDHRQEIA